MQRLREIAGAVKYCQYSYRFRANFIDDQIGQVRDAEFPCLGMTSGTAQGWKLRQPQCRAHDPPVCLLSGGRIIQSNVIYDSFKIAGCRFRNDQLLQRDQPCFAAIPAKTLSAGITLPSRAAAIPALTEYPR